MKLPVLWKRREIVEDPPLEGELLLKGEPDPLTRSPLEDAVNAQRMAADRAANQDAVHTAAAQMNANNNPFGQGLGQAANHGLSDLLGNIFGGSNR